MLFEPFGKIPRLSRDVVITEKIDGTNAQIAIDKCDGDGCPYDAVAYSKVDGKSLALYAGSRNLWLKIGKNDNHGFAAWVATHADELAQLGPGRHYGEWWGLGIQRGYGLHERRFSLFNVHRWHAVRPACCHVVPTLYTGPLSTGVINLMEAELNCFGSKASPNYMNPEGMIIYHTAAKQAFKKTLKDDEAPKGIAQCNGMK